jgi:hypothetical protein
MRQQLWGYKVEEKLYVGVREQKRLNTTVLYNWYRGSFPWVKRQEREVNHSPLSSAEVKNEGSYTSTPPHVPLWRGQGKP